MKAEPCPQMQTASMEMVQRRMTATAIRTVWVIDCQSRFEMVARRVVVEFSILSTVQIERTVGPNDMKKTWHDSCSLCWRWLLMPLLNLKSDAFGACANTNQELLSILKRREKMILKLSCLGFDDFAYLRYENCNNVSTCLPKNQKIFWIIIKVKLMRCSQNATDSWQNRNRGRRYHIRSSSTHHDHGCC